MIETSIRIAVIHNSLNAMGGGERVALAIIEALKENGYETVLITLEKTNWAKLMDKWGRVEKPHREIVLLPFSPKKFFIYTRLAPALYVFFNRRKYDLIINTHGDMLITNSDITYMHYPTFMFQEELKKYQEIPWRIYFIPYKAVIDHFMKYHFSSLLITNSTYSAKAIEKISGRKPLIIYPPVEVEELLNLDSRRENIVVTIGRFSEEKRYEFIVEIARKLPEYEFHICGSVHSDRSRKYYEKIRTLIERLELKNLHLHPDIPKKELNELLARSKVYLHTMIGEHFGIAIVEGMAAGLIPVVHRSGGAWYDIVMRGRYGYGYGTIEEAIHSIKNAIQKYDEMVGKVRRRASYFSKEKFKERIIFVIKKYLRQ